MEKSKLAKLALTAFAVAATQGAVASDDVSFVSGGTFLAAGCGGSAHGCGASRNVSYAPAPSSNPYNARTNSYQADAYDPSRPQTRTYTYDINVRDNSFDAPSGAQTGRYTESYRADFQASGEISEADLLNQLNPQARAIYQSLDFEGKRAARQLASQESYRDKNLAVKEAQRRMNEGHASSPAWTNTGSYSGSYSTPVKNSPYNR